MKARISIQKRFKKDINKNDSMIAESRISDFLGFAFG